MRLFRETTGERIDLGDHCRLATGGEAQLFVHPEDPQQIVKLWHQPTPERADKVRAMLANPPADPMAAQGHVAIAWPTDRLATPRRQIVGFLMPRVEGVHPIIDFFNPKTRRQRSPLFNWFYLHRMARNLATALRALHERGYVIGDLNECNILASETALVTVVDTDSFQVWDATQGRLFRCRVGRPEFTPPELQGRSFAEINRETVHDQFGLAIVVFQLLMEGTHPFAGVYQGQGEPPTLPERIRAGHFPYAGEPHVPYTPVPIAPAFACLHPGLQNLFVRCFRDGHQAPSLRPDDLSWQYGLEEAELNLVSCHDNQQHIFSNHLSACPWCSRTAMLGGRDPFPSLAAVQAGEHLRPAPRPRTARKQTSGWSLPYPGRPAHGPHPPRPRPVPPSTPGGQVTPGSAADALRQAFGAARRNDLGWMALGLGSLAVMLALLPAGWAGLARLTGVVGVLCALGGLQAAAGSGTGWRRYRASCAGLLLSLLGLVL
jgi:DNA-binding helix-hairpin-helix protein with protein kinase domain